MDNEYWQDNWELLYRHIKEHGVFMPIIIHYNTVIDGRKRVLIAQLTHPNVKINFLQIKDETTINGSCLPKFLGLTWAEWEFPYIKRLRELHNDQT